MRGALVFNGNILAEAEFVERASAYLTSSLHEDDEIVKSCKVVLITAGWLENEYQESHVKEALYRTGVRPRWSASGHDENVQNLAIYHRYQEFLAERPTLAQRWREREGLLEDARALYLEKNSFFIASLRRSLQRLREYVPDYRLSDLLENSLTFSGYGQGRGIVADYLATDIRDTLQHLLRNDDQMVHLLAELDEQFLVEAGLYYDPEWNRLRAHLSETILSANSVFLFGGHLGVLHRCLNFFRLRPSLLEALRRGTTFYAVSAGSLMCCERIIVYDDFESGREFQLYDRGFGLVRELQIFPHCMDRIQTDDPDNLAYLSQRFRHRVCVGLNQDSFLRVEFAPRLRAVSLGHRDGVYVFNRRGEKLRYDEGQELRLGLPGRA